MFKVLNDPKKDTGSYLFSGSSVVSYKASLIYSNSEIKQILETIKTYTKTPRDFCLTLENQYQERVYVMDNISLYDIEDMTAQGLTKQTIKSENYFTVLVEGELPLS